MLIIKRFLAENQINEFIVIPTILASIAIYKRFFSIEAKKCVNHPNKSQCMFYARITAQRSTIIQLKNQLIDVIATGEERLIVKSKIELKKAQVKYSELMLKYRKIYKKRETI